MSDAYLRRMLVRAVTMLAIVAIAVVTSLTSSHAARLSAMPDHAVHVAEMIKAPHEGEASCDGDRHCGSADARMCEFICTGLSVFLPSPGGDADCRCMPISYDRPLEEFHGGRAPGLNERPPKPRLL